MSTTYRAAYYLPSTGNSAGTVMTLPEHANLSDEALRAEAIAEAHRAGIIGNDDARVTLDAFVEGLRIGDWTE